MQAHNRQCRQKAVACRVTLWVVNPYGDHHLLHSLSIAGRGFETGLPQTAAKLKAWFSQEQNLLTLRDPDAMGEPGSASKKGFVSLKPEILKVELYLLNVFCIGALDQMHISLALISMNP